MIMNMIKINKIAIKRTTPKPMTTLELDLVAALVGTTVLDVRVVVLMIDPVPIQTNKQINLIIYLPPPLARQHGASTAVY